MPFNAFRKSRQAPSKARLRSKYPLSPSQTKAVKQIVSKDQEKHVVIKAALNNQSIANTTEKYNTITLSQALGEDGRRGNYITLSSWIGRGILRVYQGEAVRMLIVQNRRQNSTPPTETNILPDGATGPYYPVEWKTSGVNVLYDRLFVGRDPSGYTSYPLNINLTKSKFLQKKIYFSADGSTDPDNSLYVILAGTDATNLSYCDSLIATISYTDS